MILFSLLILITLISIHSFIELLKIKNIFGLTLPPHRLNVLFNLITLLQVFLMMKKKLGSFIVRLLPLILKLDNFIRI